MANIEEVAKMAGVSPATVSRVLNGTTGVKRNTRERVLKAIRDSKYTPSAAARNLSRQSTMNNIGLVIPDVDNPFFVSILKRITIAADKYHYNTILFNTDEDPEREHRFLQTVKEQNLRGLIMTPLSESDEETTDYLLELEHVGIPVVLVDRRVSAADFDGVFTDDETDAFRAVEKMIRAGHTKIATIAGPQRSTPGRLRLLGYRRAMAHYGLAVPPDYVEIGDFKYESARRAAERLLALRDRPEALFTANNFSTLAALKCITENGLEIGRDISILGFDEIDAWILYSPALGCVERLSLVERPVERLAQEAMELLQARISGADAGGDSPRKMLTLSNRIVLRGSERLAR